MRKPPAIAAGLIVLCVLGCASPEEPAQDLPPQAGPSLAATGDLAFTATQAVYAAGELLGYIVTFESLPLSEERAGRLPAGTVLIQDRDFRNIGFVTPAGECFRFIRGGETEKVRQDALAANLAALFGTDTEKIELRRG